MKTVVPYLWFMEYAEEAVRFYVSIFQKSSIVNTFLATLRLTAQEFCR